MKSRSKFILIGITLLISAILLSACGNSTIKVGWKEFSGLSNTSVNYVTFDGVKKRTLRAKAGQTIEMNFEVTVEKGSLTFKLTAPDGENLWKETYSQDDDTHISVTTPEDGRYTLHITGKETVGGFDISWDVKD